MQKKLSAHTRIKLNQALTTAGDMALKRRARRIVEELELKDKDKVLEIGCGNGYYLSLLNRLGVKLSLVGVDTDQMALDDAKKFIGDDKVKLINADALKLPFTNNTFDKVVMSEVLEHVQNEKKTLAEAYRVLKADGVFTLTTCNIDYPFLWDPINWTLQHILGTHIRSGFWAGIWNQHSRMYKKDQVERLMRGTGFKISSSEVLTSWCLPFNHYIVNLIAKLFYSRMLPESIHKSMNKFQNNRQPLLISLGFRLINLFDYLNDLFSLKKGVSIFIKARK